MLSCKERALYHIQVKGGFNKEEWNNSECREVLGESWETRFSNVLAQIFLSQTL